MKKLFLFLFSVSLFAQTQTFTVLNIKGQNGVSVGQFNLFDENQANYIRLVSPNTLSANFIISLPTPTGSSGCWGDNGFGVTSIVSCGSGGSGGVNEQTTNYTALSGDSGKLIVFNSASTTTLTLPASPPSSTWSVFVQSIGSSVAGTIINPNGLLLDGGSGNVGIHDLQGIYITTDGTNYFSSRTVPFGQAAYRTTSLALSAVGSGVLYSFSSSSALTLTLPSSAPYLTWTTLAQNLGTGNLTIDPNGLDIDGSASSLVLTTGQGLYITTDGTNYYTMRGTGPTANQNYRPIGATFVGVGGAITGTTINCHVIPSSGTITGVYTNADISGSATIGIKTVAYASYTGTAGYSGYTNIVGSTAPSLSSAVDYSDTTLTGWTTSLTAGQYICIQLSSPSTVTNVTVMLQYGAS